MDSLLNRRKLSDYRDYANKRRQAWDTFKEIIEKWEEASPENDLSSIQDSIHQLVHAHRRIAEYIHMENDKIEEDDERLVFIDKEIKRADERIKAYEEEIKLLEKNPAQRKRKEAPLESDEKKVLPAPFKKTRFTRGSIRFGTEDGTSTGPSGEEASDDLVESKEEKAPDFEIEAKLFELKHNKPIAQEGLEKKALNRLLKVQKGLAENAAYTELLRLIILPSTTRGTLIAFLHTNMIYFQKGLLNVAFTNTAPFPNIKVPQGGTADEYAQFSYGLTPLMWAARYSKSKPVISLLLELAEPEKKLKITYRGQRLNKAYADNDQAIDIAHTENNQAFIECYESYQASLKASVTPPDQIKAVSSSVAAQVVVGNVSEGVASSAPVASVAVAPVEEKKRSSVPPKSMAQLRPRRPAPIEIDKDTSWDSDNDEDEEIESSSSFSSVEEGVEKVDADEGVESSKDTILRYEQVRIPSDDRKDEEVDGAPVVDAEPAVDYFADGVDPEAASLGVGGFRLMNIIPRAVAPLVPPVPRALPAAPIAPYSWQADPAMKAVPVPPSAQKAVPFLLPAPMVAPAAPLGIYVQEISVSQVGLFGSAPRSPVSPVSSALPPLMGQIDLFGRRPRSPVSPVSPSLPPLVSQEEYEKMVCAKLIK